MTLTKILVPICFYCLNCTKFVQLILRKIIKIVATRCQILRLKRSSDPLAKFEGPTSTGKGKEREGRERAEGRGGEGEKGGKGKGRERKGREERGGKGRRGGRGREEA